ncbi:hypothetical protein A7H1H_0875 [Aliarcobacter butzleri 7h1h]|uniref:hypothetical protein n=1 Tax=Aliarcobacter butzleri TaxID=28197 RepID=UPI0002F486F8|nr:hypothetical protein [Aliarcobacter butzleri]AGR77179.1 hypothetical protein A7H1H_0875 [Aliarcobacter butzleri 7h1h]
MMKKYILAAITIIFFGGCQQALDELNKSLLQVQQNINSNFSQNTVNFNIKKVSDEELSQRFENYKTIRTKFFKKFLVKIDSTEEDFTIRFNNKEKLVNERNEIYKFLISEIDYFYDYAIKYENFKYIDREFSKTNYNNNIKYGITPSGSFGDSDLDSKYFGYYMNNGRILGYEIDTIDKYENYLAFAKSTQKENAIFQKRLQDNKIVKEKQIQQENKERAKVKSACESWLEKAKKDVYSLGVGDYVVNMARKEAGGTYLIRAIEKNTFLLYAYIYGQFYGQKSDYIPESALKTAPSVYCYK